MLLTNWISSRRAHKRKRTQKLSIMDLLSRAKDKLSGEDKISNGGSPSRSPARSSRRNSPPGRVIPPEPVQQQVNGDFSQHDAERPLQLHNLARANRRCKKLEWDEDLAREAESYAQTMASTGIVEHSDVGAQGENLFVSADDASFEDAVDCWLNEEKKYHGEHIGEGNLADWGHFTQAIWHSTTHLGMGKARAKSGHTYIVGRYSPAGNVPGEKPYEDGDSSRRF